jgi:hypothetical protein
MALPSICENTSPPEGFASLTGFPAERLGPLPKASTEKTIMKAAITKCIMGFIYSPLFGL